RFHFRRCDVPVWPEFLEYLAQVLTQILHRGPAEEPIAHVDLIYDEPRLEHDRMRNHRIVTRVGVLGDVDIFLDDSPRIGKKWPVRAYAGAKLIRFSDVVSADCDQPAVAHLHFTMKLNKSFMLAPIFRTKTSAAQNDNHRILFL